MNFNHPSFTTPFLWCTFFLSLFYMTSSTSSFTHNYLIHCTAACINPQSKVVVPVSTALVRPFYNVWRNQAVRTNITPLIYLSSTRPTHRIVKVTTYSNRSASSAFLYTKSVFYGSNRRGNLLKSKDVDITLV